MLVVEEAHRADRMHGNDTLVALLQDCKKQAKKEERPQRPESEALTHQKTMLAGGNSEFDYFLYSNEDNVDFGIKISDPRARVFFTICKQRADKGSLRAVQHMFNLLVDTAAEVCVCMRVWLASRLFVTLVSSLHTAMRMACYMSLMIGKLLSMIRPYDTCAQA